MKIIEIDIEITFVYRNITMNYYIHGTTQQQSLKHSLCVGSLSRANGLVISHDPLLVIEAPKKNECKGWRALERWGPGPFRPSLLGGNAIDV
jgi:hypothetical protein